MKIIVMKQHDQHWDAFAQQIQSVTWTAGRHLAHLMYNHAFLDWERVIVFSYHGQLVGFCALLEHDIVPAVQSPFVGYVFVNNSYRGQGLSEQLISRAETLAQQLGFDTTYIVTRHVGLYERLGYELFDHRQDRFGRENRMLMKSLKLMP